MARFPQRNEDNYFCRLHLRRGCRPLDSAIRRLYNNRRRVELCLKGAHGEKAGVENSCRQAACSRLQSPQRTKIGTQSNSREAAYAGGEKEAGARAAEHARSGKGPYILEMKTYRYRGHSMSDPAKYRTKEEVDEVKKTRDPIEHLRERLASVKVTEDELKVIDAEVKAIVAAAAEFARTSPEPDPSELYTDVYLEAAQ